MTEDKMNDDLLLEQFFSKAREQEIADDGFTERVVSQLPDRSLRLSRLWTAFCLVIGVVLFFVFKGWLSVLLFINSLIDISPNNFNPLPLFVTLGALSSIAVFELASRQYKL